MTSLIWIGLMASAAGIGVWFWMRRDKLADAPQSSAPAARAAPLRSQNPKHMAGQAHPKLWQVCVDEHSCASARTMAGHRLEIEDTVALPLPGCGNTACHCYYKAVTDPRRRQRRAGEDRRDMLRYTTEKPERRVGDERRKHDREGSWTAKTFA